MSDCSSAQLGVSTVSWLCQDRASLQTGDMGERPVSLLAPSLGSGGGAGAAGTCPHSLCQSELEYPNCFFLFKPDKLGWRQIAQRTVRPFVVVIEPIAFRNVARGLIGVRSFILRLSVAHRAQTFKPSQRFLSPFCSFSAKFHSFETVGATV